MMSIIDNLELVAINVTLIYLILHVRRVSKAWVDSFNDLKKKVNFLSEENYRNVSNISKITKFIEEINIRLGTIEGELERSSGSFLQLDDEQLENKGDKA